jgi:hypothetical protein
MYNDDPFEGELRRKIGRKALDTGGNAIIGYTQSFDLEGESGIVVRGIGTSATVVNVTPFIIPTSTSQVFHGESVERYNELLLFRPSDL